MLALASMPALATDYTWSSGGQYGNTDVSPSAPSTLLSGDTLTISDGGYFSGAGGLTTDSGSVVTWTAGSLGFANGAAVANGGLWNADSSTALSMYDNGYGGTFTNTGTLENSGTGALTIQALGSFSFANSGGEINATTGSVDFVSGSSGQVQFANGSSYAGAGEISIGGGGAQFTGTQNFLAGSNVVFAAGDFYNNYSTTAAATLNGDATWNGGSFYGGAFSLTSGSTLTVTTTSGGNTKFFDATSFTNNGTIVWTTSDEVGLQNGTTLTNNGTFLVTAATSFVDASYGGTFVNVGKLENSGGGAVAINASGSFSFQNTADATITADKLTDSITFNSGSAGQATFANNSNFNGSGTIEIAGGGAVFTGNQNIAAVTNFVFAAGYFEPGTGGATINGNATWSGGTFYGGAWTLPSGDTLTAVTTSGGNTKFFDATSFTNNGTIAWTTSDEVGLQNGTTLTNNGTFLVTAPTSFVDASYGGTFVNVGKLVDNGGGAVAVNPSGSFSFQNSAGGTITATKSTDSITFTSGNYAQASFATNTVFSGAGTITIAGDGATFDGTQTIAAGTSFDFAAGYYVPGTSGAATLSGNATWSGGTFYGGAWTLPSGDTLTAVTTSGGNTKFFDATSFTNNGTIAWTTSDEVGLQNGTTLTNNGTFLVTAPTSFVDASYGGTFVNVGKLVDNGGGAVAVNPSGSFSFQNSAGGTITATKSTDSITFTSGNYAQASFATNTVFSGAGTITIAGDGATFDGTQTIAAGTSFDFAAGYYVPGTSGAATLSGNATWSGGAFYSGAWTLPSGDTLTAVTTPGGNTKYFDATAFTNNGTIAWTTTDDVLLQNGSLVTNNGTFVTTAPTTLVDGGYGGTFTNVGTLENNSGATLTVQPGGSFDFANAAGGTINAPKAADTILFNSGSSAQLTFANNSNFTGLGTIEIANAGATFTGNQLVGAGTTFVLAAGYFVPGTGGATLKGSISWTGGQFYGGSWALASGSILNVAGNGGATTKFFNATTFTNGGTINWNTADPIYLANGAAIVNNGVFSVTQDASFADGGYGGTLTNNGLLEKTGGTGTTSVAPGGSFAGLVNNGVTAVESGTIALGSSFTNPGTLAGTGTFTAGTLTNNGHVAPGTYLGAPGALALTGNYVQGASGFLDIGATGTANGLFNVSGTASLAGTVDVICDGSCTYSEGTRLLILSSTGLTVDPLSIVQTGFTGTNDFSLLQSGNNEYLVFDKNVTAAVPEPSTYAMILAGLGLLGGAVRRRRLVTLIATPGQQAGLLAQ